MDKVYYENTYLRELECTVLQVSRSDKAAEVLTDRTIFYPESGGQPGDRGFLGPFEVLDTRKDSEGNSVLILPKDCPVKEGSVYKLVLDWDHRYKFMVIHAAQHMLSGLLYTMYAIGTVAVHQGDDYLTIETDRDEIPEDVIDGLILAANEKIRENHAIVYHQMSHADAEALGLRRSIKVEGDVRIVEIEDVDRIACGGVHVARTGEIGLIYCIGHEQIRGHVRLYFKCGKQAVEESLENNRIVRSLSRTLTCRSDELEGKINTLQQELTLAKSRNEHAGRELSVYEIRENIEADGICILEAQGELQGYAPAVEKFDDLALLVLDFSDSKRTKWLIALKGKFEKVDFNKDIRPLLATVNAKGGGRSPVFQGAADCTDKEAFSQFKDGFRKACLSL